MAASLSAKQAMVSALCKRFSSDPAAFLSKAGEHDIKSLLSDILKSSTDRASADHNEEVTKWIEFAESFPVNTKACIDGLSKLNEDLVPKSVLLGNGVTPSEADVIVFSTIHSSVVGLSNMDRQKLPHLMRWFDYIQHKEHFGESFEKITLEKAIFAPPEPKIVAKSDEDPKTKKTVESLKSADKSQADSNTKKSDKKGKVDGQANQESKKAPGKEPAEKDKEIDVSLLNIRVGLIRKAWKHPSADSLLVEEIDVGEAKLRQVVSGLAKYCSPDELTNRRVVLITNVKPGKLRDVMSEGLVLCASNEDHSVVEPLLPPEGAKLGELVSFSGIDGKPEEVLNPKKKQLEKITPHLFTDEKGVATYKGTPFMTSGGPCVSSIPKASIK
ncbi:uncharacterized protein LOC115672303 [Syzygium oleosum]|uniref:uncharacterized protein LOC115672303 n=1 Tax=Syzygium oleosum TaxID=219896 RepID=UPI0011D28F75|nr:uncharacterized protein LOC115672303 [Syzygium oleosum]